MHSLGCTECAQPCIFIHFGKEGIRRGGGNFCGGAFIYSSHLFLFVCKTNHYRNWNVPVIPFAIEATGRLSPSALKYTSSIWERE